MSNPAENEPLPPSDAPAQDCPTARIDKICDEFEKAWRAGSPPRIEDVLAGADIPQRSRLFDELLEIELDFLQRGGAEPKPEDYSSRYPERAEQVAAVFRRSTKTRRLGDYELLDELGRGGMGVVYRARQIFLQQIVALKVLPQRYLNDSQAVSRFKREMQLIGSLDHPNIVRAFNAGEAAGTHYLVMEFVDGLNLQSYVGWTSSPSAKNSDRGGRRDGRLPQRQEEVHPTGGPLALGAACEIIRQAALGLQHAHEHRLVHRDIKPGNIMVNRAGVVKLLDLGLAKFLAEQGDEPSTAAGGGRLADKLTQTGVAMGTVDFMAPEQWEHPSRVDIRCDIYSLGCTFYFLLSGQPPFGGPNYNTSRKKLMAHVVAPPPSLSEACAQRQVDFPIELEDIYSRMMAKTPAERFATPGDVAAAMAEFADSEELSDLMASYTPSVPPIVSENPPTDVAVDTEKKPHTAFSKRAASRKQVQRQRLLLYGSVLVAVTAALAVGITWFVAAHWPRRRMDFQSVPILPGRTGSPSYTWDRQAAAADLALLPGLNGAWWFDETPWYLPFVRQAVVERMAATSDPAALLGSDPHIYFNPNVAAVRVWLWEVAGHCRPLLSAPEARLVDDLRSISESGLRGAPLSAALADALHRFDPGSAAQLSPADRHTLALLQHKISVLNNDRNLALQARRNYEQAARDYARQPAQAAMHLRWLCLADAALFDSHVLSDFKEAKRLYESILSNPAPNVPYPDSPLFRIDTLVAYGSETAFSAATSNEYGDLLFVYAKKVFDASPGIPRSHPLAAHIDERYAWSLMDQWKENDAAGQFQEAYIIRSENKREENPFAAIYMFYDSQGTGLTARYRGNPDGARRTFGKIVEDAEAARDKAEGEPPWPGQQRFLLELRERIAAGQERWADCELYSGAASGLPVNLAQASDLYEKARSATTDVGYNHVLTCKLAIVRASHGQAAEARALIDQLDRPGGEILGGESERATLMRQAANAVLTLKEKGASEGQKALRAFLDQFRLNPAYRDTARRETLELQLFCADLLLSSELELREEKRPHKDLHYLDPLLATFNGRLDMRPFLRRFYELATRACEKNDLVQIAHYILESRMAPQSGALRSKQVTLVLFQFTPQENFAIFLPQDGRPGKRFDLDLRREQIEEAATHGKTLHLNDELVKMMNDEVAAGRSLEISWSDVASRPSGDNTALTDAQWPFDPQFELGSAKK